MGGEAVEGAGPGCGGPRWGRTCLLESWSRPFIEAASSARGLPSSRFAVQSLAPNEKTSRPSCSCGSRGRASRIQRAATSALVSRRMPKLYAVTSRPPWRALATTRPTHPSPSSSPVPLTKLSPKKQIRTINVDNLPPYKFRRRRSDELAEEVRSKGLAKIRRRT